MEKGIQNAHGARPANQVIQSMWWTRTSRLSINKSLSLEALLSVRRSVLSVRVTTRAEDAQGTPPTQSHISPSVLVYKNHRSSFRCEDSYYEKYRLLFRCWGSYYENRLLSFRC